MKDDFASSIRSIREQRGMTQDEFSEFCGLSRSAIARYELGTSVPNRKVLEKIASALHMTISSLVGDDPAQSPDPDDEVWQLREELRRDPERRTLFDAAKNVKKEDILTAVRILDAFAAKGGDDGE